MCEENSTVNVQGWHEEIDVAHGSSTSNIQYSQILQQQTMIFSEFLHYYSDRYMIGSPISGSPAQQHMPIIVGLNIL